jgi:hypothetical protein
MSNVSRIIGPPTAWGGVGAKPLGQVFSVSVRHEEPMRHSFLEVFEHAALPSWHADRQRFGALDSERIDAMLEKAERGVIDGTYIAVTPQFLVTARIRVEPHFGIGLRRSRPKR